MVFETDIIPVFKMEIFFLLVAVEYGVRGLQHPHFNQNADINCYNHFKIKSIQLFIINNEHCL